MSSPTDSVTVFAPATVANLAAGYDCLGLAISGPGDEITASFSDSSGVRISAIEGDGGKLPLEAAKNTAGIAAQDVLDRLNKGHLGIDLVIRKKMPFGSGLGSSAASAVGGAYAVNCLLGHPLERGALLDSALLGESYASGSRHADNVAPCLFGGLVLVRTCTAQDLCHLPIPRGLHIAVVHPDVEILTKDAREVVSKTVPTAIATAQMADIAAFVHACHLGDLHLLSRCMTDRIAEPGRASLITGFPEARIAAIDAGGIGFSISGAGPSVFSFAPDEAAATRIAGAISTCFDAHNITNTSHISAINAAGVEQL